MKVPNISGEPRGELRERIRSDTGTGAKHYKHTKV